MSDEKKYVGSEALIRLVAQLKAGFATLTHKHTLSDITDYVVDSSLSADSTNPVQNQALKAEFQSVQTALDGKAAASHGHAIADVTDLQSTIDSMQGEIDSNESSISSLQTEVDTKATMFGYTATSTDGVAYTATVDGITELAAGIHFTIVPSMTSTSITPTLDVNGLGAAMLRTRVSGNTATTAAAVNANWLSTGKPVEVVYDGRWWMVNFIRPNAPDLYGTVAIANGGTGATTAETARTNLEVYSKTEVDDLLSSAGGQVQFITWESTD